MSLITNDIIRFQGYQIDRLQWRLSWRDEAIRISRKTFDVLLYLVEHADRVVGKEELLRALWPESFVEESNLTQHIFLLRKALSLHSTGEQIIVTVPGRGYRFAAVIETAAKVIAQPGTQNSVIFTSEESITRVTIAEEITDEEIPVASTPPGRRTILDGSATNSSSPPLLLASGERNPLSRYKTALLIAVAAIVAGVAWLATRPTITVQGFVRLTNDGLVKDLSIAEARVVTDGQQIFFTEYQANQHLISRVSVNGGETTSTPAPDNESAVSDVLPLRKELLLGSSWQVGDDHPMRIINIASGAVQTLWGVRAHDGSWSPDGSKLAYAQGSSLFATSPSGSGTIKLASLPGILYWPRWSPDGKLVRFSQNFAGYHSHLWEVNADGSNLHEFLPGSFDKDPVCCGSWTPSGRSFVFVSMHSTSSDICVLPERLGPWKVEAGSVFRIKSEPLDRWSSPVPSPDGKHLYAIGEQLHGKLVRIDPQSRRPEPYLAGLSAEGVAFSPDGDSIAFTSFPEGTLWQSGKDGKGRVRLTLPPLIARFPRWSPDGKSIVFLAGKAGSDWRLYTVPAGGGTIQRLTQAGEQEGVANWSPDGRAISFGRLIDYSSSAKPSLNIDILNLNDGKTSILPGSEGLWTARWSPDGHFMSALTRDSSTLRLYDFRAGLWSDAVKMGINDVAWSPDSKYLFFDTSASTDPIIYRLRISDRKLEPWAELHETRRGGFFGSWLGVSPDGDPIFLEEASIQEIYSITAELP